MRAHVHVRWFMQLCGTISDAQGALGLVSTCFSFSLLCGYSVFKLWTSILLFFVIKKDNPLVYVWKLSDFLLAIEIICKQRQYFREYSVVVF